MVVIYIPIEEKDSGITSGFVNVKFVNGTEQEDKAAKFIIAELTEVFKRLCQQPEFIRAIVSEAGSMAQLNAIEQALIQLRTNDRNKDKD